jgi:hypothetical protein
MADNPSLKGLDKVMQNLNKEIQKIANQTPAGLITASIIIQRATEKESPKTPVDTSNLRGSFFRVVTGFPTDNKGRFQGKDAGTLSAEYASAITQFKSDVEARRFPTLILGFSANYAIWVHENMEAKFQRPGAGPKFLEEAVNNNKGLILNAIRDNVKIK